MVGKLVIRDITSGFEYSYYIGCDMTDGEALLGTADEVIGGWAPTEEEARTRAHDTL